MVNPTAMNTQITGAVTQTNVEVIAEASAQAIVALCQIANHFTGLSLQNAVYSQQALNQISTAVVSEAVLMVMAIGDKKGI